MAPLSESERRATRDFLRSHQDDTGFLPWVLDGHGDPWNHVEAAMALTVLGDVEGAARAYDWLRAHQLGEGAWFNYYRSGTVENSRLDTNVSAYVAVGVLHFAVATQEWDDVSRWWPMVERALDFAVSLRRGDGTVSWSLDARGRRESGALVTGCSSVLHSLECGLVLARRRGERRDHWENAATELRRALRDPATNFLSKTHSMDWYYPVLVGAFDEEEGREHLRRGESRFVIEGQGIRCVSTSDWVTAAETAECALAWALLGEEDVASRRLEETRRHRRDDGSYLTGLVEPGPVSFPQGECTTYSAAAVVLADDALRPDSSVRRSFRPALREALEDA